MTPMKNKSLLMIIAILIIASYSVAQETDAYTDLRDGKVYKTVTIGTQTWMAENLAFKTENDCWAYNDDITNVETFGYLYSWEKAKVSCPNGWHLSTKIEWDTLTSFVGEDEAADILSDTEEIGFFALPGGSRNSDGEFSRIGTFGYWWTATEKNTENAWYVTMNADFSDVYSAYFLKGGAYSVRCVKD